MRQTIRMHIKFFVQFLLIVEAMMSSRFWPNTASRIRGEKFHSIIEGTKKYNIRSGATMVPPAKFLWDEKHPETRFSRSLVKYT